jgi:hypothetical protein
MAWGRLVFVAAAALLEACVPATSPPVAAPPVVSIRLENVLISPTQANGRDWNNGFDAQQASTVQSGVQAALMALDPRAAVFALLAGPVSSRLAQPKPEGTAQICARTGCGRQIPITGQTNSLTPMFGVPFAHVTLDDTTLLRVSLMDHRWLGFANLPIGTVDLNARDLLTASSQGAGHVYDVRVDDQGTHQILFVGISVIREQ